MESMSLPLAVKSMDHVDLKTWVPTTTVLGLLLYYIFTVSKAHHVSPENTC